MKKEGYYSCGEFAKKANVTIRTIRFYDKQNILKPSYKNENGARFYTNRDLAKLQQILLFKYLGLSLDDIKEMTVAAVDPHFIVESLEIQKKLVRERIEEMKNMEMAIDQTIGALKDGDDVEWKEMLNLIQMTTMEDSLKTQYVDAANINARIRLHQEYSVNKEGWFPWLFRQYNLQDGMKVLEIGCGNGELWLENKDKIKNVEVILSDVSEGMIRDVKRSIGKDSRFTYSVFDCKSIPFEDCTFDVIIANHVLFYCDELQKCIQEIYRVLKKDGTFYCSTYGKQHMHEITDVVQEFNPDIVLSADHLYEKFGLENGKDELEYVFDDVTMKLYEDAIEMNSPEVLISYILSCHGNQNHILLDRYKEFKEFVESKVKDGFHITKEAGMFIAKK